MGTNRPKVGTGAFIVKDGMILLGKRKNAHGDGSWGLTGGHLELLESWEECVNRETKEETGLDIKNINHIFTTNDIFQNEKLHYVTLFFSADYYAGEVKIMEPDKFEQWKWCNIDNLPSPLFLPLENLLKNNMLLIKRELGL